MLIDITKEGNINYNAMLIVKYICSVLEMYLIIVRPFVFASYFNFSKLLIGLYRTYHEPFPSIFQDKFYKIDCFLCIATSDEHLPKISKSVLRYTILSGDNSDFLFAIQKAKIKSQFIDRSFLVSVG